MENGKKAKAVISIGILIIALLAALAIFQGYRLNKLNEKVGEFENLNPIGTYLCGDVLADASSAQYIVLEHDGTYCRYIPHSDAAGEVLDRGSYSKADDENQANIYSLNSTDKTPTSAVLTQYGIFIASAEGKLYDFKKLTDTPTYVNFTAPHVSAATNKTVFSD